MDANVESSITVSITRRTTDQEEALRWVSAAEQLQVPYSLQKRYRTEKKAEGQRLYVEWILTLSALPEGKIVAP